MTAEEWRPVPEFDGYEASDLGRVRSHRRRKVRVLRPAVTLKGYLVVNLRGSDGTWRVRKVHALVMRAFVGQPPEGQVCRHMDGDPANNTLSNLRYGTPSENIFDQVRHGTHAFASRTQCKNGHEFTPENTTRWASSPGRICLACARAKQNRRNERRRKPVSA